MNSCRIYQIPEEIITGIHRNLSVPETGGILGVNIHDRRTVTAFHYDSTGTTEKHSYTPDIKALNKIIAEWAEEDIEFIGFVHSHPQNSERLSPQDVHYAQNIMRTCDMPEILMMLYLPDTEELYQYILFPDK